MSKGRPHLLHGFVWHQLLCVRRDAQLLTGGGIGKLRIMPMRLKKGGTEIALYGLGHQRDERLARVFAAEDAVQWCALTCHSSTPLVYA